MAEHHRRAAAVRWDGLTAAQRREQTAAARAARWPDPDAPAPSDPFAELRSHFDAQFAALSAQVAELREQVAA